MLFPFIVSTRHSGKSLSRCGDDLWCPRFALVVVVVVVLGTEDIRRHVFSDAHRQCAMLALPPSFFFMDPPVIIRTTENSLVMEEFQGCDASIMVHMVQQLLKILNLN